MRYKSKQSGFSAVELLITLFIAAIFLITGFQLYAVIIKNGGEARQKASATNIIADYLQRYKSTATNPCTVQTPLTNFPITIPGLSNVTVTVAIQCPYSSGTYSQGTTPNTVSEIIANVQYGTPQQTISNATFVSSQNSGIVTSGLVLDLDAGNTASYPSSGITWTDLSGNGNNATMYGSVPFNSGTASNFDFSTVTSSIPSGNITPGASLGFTFASNMVTRTGDFTFSTWIRNPPSVSSQIGLFSNAGGGDGYRFGISLVQIYYLVGPPYGEGSINFLTPIQSNTWNNIVAVFKRSASKVSLYLNGVYQNSASIPASQTIMVNTAPGIVRSACCQLYTGKISSFSVYNTVLSPSEINQNFNALRSRYQL